MLSKIFLVTLTISLVVAQRNGGLFFVTSSSLSTGLPQRDAGLLSSESPKSSPREILYAMLLFRDFMFSDWFAIKFEHNEFKYEDEDGEEQSSDQDDVRENEESQPHGLDITDLAGGG